MVLSLGCLGCLGKNVKSALNSGYVFDFMHHLIMSVVGVNTTVSAYTREWLPMNINLVSRQEKLHTSRYVNEYTLGALDVFCS